MSNGFEQKLTAIGLDEKEIRFYLAALQVGSAPVAEIASLAKIARTNGYDIFARLEGRGIVTQATINGVRHVVAEDPIVLFKNWNRTHDMLNELVPELRSLFNAAPHKPTIRFYEGDEGIEHVLGGVLACRSKQLSGILCMHELLEVPGYEGMQAFIAERIKKNIELRVLRSRSHETADIWPSSKAELRSLRFAPDFVDLAMTMFVHDNTVSYLSSKKEHYGLIIQNPEFASLQRSMFEGIWAISEQDKPQSST